MTCAKSCKTGKHICPFSFGLALGVTVALAFLLVSFWVMYHGVTPMMEAYNVAAPTTGEVFMGSLWMLLKGFIFGFFLALFYDLFVCCMACCRKKCDCSCGCCSGNSRHDQINKHNDINKVN